MDQKAATEDRHALGVNDAALVVAAVFAVLVLVFALVHMWNLVLLLLLVDVCCLLLLLLLTTAAISWPP